MRPHHDQALLTPDEQLREPAGLSGQVAGASDRGPLIARLADLQDRIGLAVARVGRVREQLRAVQGQRATFFVRSSAGRVGNR